MQAKEDKKRKEILSPTIDSSHRRSKRIQNKQFIQKINEEKLSLYRRENHYQKKNKIPAGISISKTMKMKLEKDCGILPSE